jgi:hypothetical protein
LRLTQAAPNHFQSNRQAASGTLDEIGGARGDERGHFRFLMWRANDYDWRMLRQGGYDGVEARHFGERSFAFRTRGCFLEQDDAGRGIGNDTPRSVHGSHLGNAQPFFPRFKFSAGSGA